MAQDDKPKVSTTNHFLETIKKYCSVTTISGVQYIAEETFGIISRIFWFIVGIILIILASFLITKSYNDWQDDPILTSVKTNQYPISKLEFPAITICGLGHTEATLVHALFHQAISYIDKRRGKNKVTITDEYDYKHFLKVNDISLEEFLSDTFPGFDNTSLDSLWKMASNSPDMDLLYNTLIINSSNDLLDSDHIACDGEDEAFDEANNYCYRIAGKGTLAQANTGEFCSYSEHLFFIIDDRQLEGFAGIIEKASGPFATLNGEYFLTAAERNDQTQAIDLTTVFTTNEFSIARHSTASPMRYITVNTAPSNVNKKCFVLQYDNSTGTFRGKEVHCFSTGTPTTVVCMRSTGHVDDTENPDKLKYLYNSRFKKPWQKMVAGKKQKFLKELGKMGDRKSFESWLELLWYAQIPCYDHVHPHNNAMLKRCVWKNQQVPCASIFKPFPTDRGMCCAFNMRAADEIFYNSTYQRVITKMQQQDAKSMYSHSHLPEAYIKEPDPQAGIYNGLSIILDAHTDKLTAASVTEDFQGFVTHIGSPSHYPLLSLNNILIRPGHHNLVALSATDIQSSESIINVALDKRNCYFSNEYKLELHNNYSQASCLLECHIQYAIINVTLGPGENKENGTYCIPWFLPRQDSANMCDPWVAVAFKKVMNDVPDASCQHCLPDCVMTEYHSSVSAVPFRRCDELNLGASFLCDLENWYFPDPQIFGSQVMNELHDYDFQYKEFISSNIRRYQTMNQPVFPQMAGHEYNAFEKDFASVNFYFDKSSIFQFKRDLRMSNTDFLGLVGGLLGLCNGFSLCSAVEILFWFSYVLCSKLWKSHDKCSIKNRDPEGDATGKDQSVHLREEVLALKEVIGRQGRRMDELLNHLAGHN